MKVMSWIVIVLILILSLIRSFDWTHLKYAALLLLLFNVEKKQSAEHQHLYYLVQAVFLTGLFAWRLVAGVWPYSNPATVALMSFFYMSDNLRCATISKKHRWASIVLSIVEALIIILIEDIVVCVGAVLLLSECAKRYLSENAKKIVTALQLILLIATWIYLWTGIRLDGLELNTWFVGGEMMITNNDFLLIIAGYGMVGVILYLIGMFKLNSKTVLIMITIAFFTGFIMNFACVPMMVLMKSEDDKWSPFVSKFTKQRFNENHDY